MLTEPAFKEAAPLRSTLPVLSGGGREKAGWLASGVVDGIAPGNVPAAKPGCAAAKENGHGQ